MVTNFYRVVVVLLLAYVCLAHQVTTQKINQVQSDLNTQLERLECDVDSLKMSIDSLNAMHPWRKKR